jgi:hypothetical protein
MRLRHYASRALSPQQAVTVEHPQQESLSGNAQSFSQGLDGIGDKLQRRDQSDEVETPILERERERITQQIVRAIAQACLFEHGGRRIQSCDVETLFREPAGKMTGPTSNWHRRLLAPVKRCNCWWSSASSCRTANGDCHIYLAEARQC